MIFIWLYMFLFTVILLSHLELLDRIFSKTTDPDPGWLDAALKLFRGGIPGDWIYTFEV